MTKVLEILNKHKILNLSELDDYTIDMYNAYYKNTEGTTDELTYDEFTTLKEWQDDNLKINNSNPSEALKCLKKICDVSKNDMDINIGWIFEHEIDTIKQALLKAQEQEKVLEIIKKKNVDILLIKNKGNVNQYNEYIEDENDRLTQEEFDLVKRYCNEQDN